MTHECNTATLWCSTEVDNSEISVFDILDIPLHRAPSRFADRTLVITDRGETYLSMHVDLDFIAISNSKSWLFRGAESAEKES